MEAIQKLLQSTGLSPDELIKQLSEYKAKSGDQQNSTPVGEEDENKNGTALIEKTNGSAISASISNDKILNGFRTECTNVKDLSPNSESQSYLSNTSSNSVNSDRNSVTNGDDLSDIVDNECEQVFQWDKPQETYTIIQIGNNSPTGEINTELSNVIHHNSNQDFIEEQLDSSEELSFNEELQISEEDVNCDEAIQTNREAKRLFTCKKATREGKLLFRSYEEQPKEKTLNLDGSDGRSPTESSEGDTIQIKSEENKTDTQLQENEDQIINENSNSSTSSKKLTGIKRKSSELNLTTDVEINEELKTASELPAIKEDKDCIKLSSSDKLGLVWGLPLGKDLINEKELSLSDKLRSAWGLPPAKMFKTDKPLVKCNKFKLLSWGKTNAKKNDSLPINNNFKSTWDLPKSEMELVKSCNNEPLKSVSDKTECNKKVFNIENLTSIVNRDECNLICNEVLTTEELTVSNEKANEVIENSKSPVSNVNLDVLPSGCNDQQHGESLSTKNVDLTEGSDEIEKTVILLDSQEEISSETQDENVTKQNDGPCNDLPMEDDEDDDCTEVICKEEDLDYVESGYVQIKEEEVMDDSDDTIVNSEDAIMYIEKCKKLNEANNGAINEIEEEQCLETSDINNTEDSRKRPTMGYIRKRSEKSKEKKSNKPPWLDNDQPEQSNDNVNMRKQIFTQLEQLRKRKIDETPLVNIAHPIPKTYRKRCKTVAVPEDSSSHNLGIKIVDVRGGIKEDTRREEVSNLGIKLTKTQDITKIKGWRRKKLLVVENGVKAPSITVKTNEPNLLINIPVITKNINIAASCSFPITKKTEEGVKAIEDAALNVFASNNLEGFLNQQKKLNISYNVPNLESSNHTIDYLDSTVLITQPPEEKSSSDNKRRYTLAENENCNTLKQNNKSDTNKPRTLAEKRKLLEKSETSSKEDTESSMLYSNIYYKGYKFTVPSRYKKAIYIDCNRKTNKQYKYVEIDNKGRKDKPSILNSQATIKPEIKYKPGPLCRKPFLQEAGQDKWITVLRKLPMLKVEVTPKIGRPLHPKVTPFIKFETFDISEERADFALSALIGNTDNKSFSFDVNYVRQQENILMRKKIIKEEIKTEINIEPETKVYTEDVDGVVQHMLDDLITCIEIKEIEKHIIKDDPDFTPYVEDTVVPLKYEEKKSKTQIIKGSARRTNLELKRLNVKVIEVNIEDDQKPMDECTKPFCKLGCVCNSLNKTTLPSDHCANYQCIFKCKCTKKSGTLKVNLPSGTDILSERTVSRLEDAAKKNLAKVEKEFTQTVIHANNNTILFSDTKDRKRRSLKFPKRYQDYIETNLLVDDIDNEPIKLIESIPVPEKKQLPQMSPCSVKLQRLNLEHVIPYCWAHNVYDCDCGCTTLLMKNNIQAVEVKPDNPGLTQGGTEEFPRVKKFKEAQNCARTKGLSTTFYLHRNRMPKFKKKIAKKILADGSSNDLLKKWFNMKALDTKSNQHELHPEPNTSLEVKPSRRKQVLITRDELAQRAKENHIQIPTNDVTYENIEDLDLFQDSLEVFKPSETMLEQFNQLLRTSNDKEPQYRLVKWSILLNKYQSGNWEVWTTKTNSKVCFVVTNSNVKKLNNYINIRSFTTVADKESIQTNFIRWIMTGSFPDDRDPENILLILKKSNFLWEVCGMCTRNMNKKERIEVEKPIGSLKNTLFSQKVPFAICEYLMKELACTIEPSEDPLSIVQFNESTKIKVGLPNIPENCRWRVLKVKSTFNVLAFTRNQIRIKCSELLTLIKLSQRESKTLIINKVSKCFNHKQFGIYISHTHLDKIFVGPYFDYEAHDFETLRFLNNKLVSTEEFCKMTGQKIDAPTGTWYKQITAQKQTIETAGSVIDLTEIEDNVQNQDLDVTDVDSVQDTNFMSAESNHCSTSPNSVNDESSNGSKAKSPTYSSRSLLKLNNLPELNEIVVNNEKKETASIEKIYLTGLKHLMKEANYTLPSGTYPVCFKVNFCSEFILGFKYIAEEMVGVFWPTVEKPRLFQTHILASEWLKSELCKLFVFIPRAFKVIVNLVEYSGYLKAMTKVMKAMSLTAYLEEVHIVGSFGILKMTDVINLMCDCDFKPTKPKHLKNKLKNNSLEYRTRMLRFLKKNKVNDVELARVLILQMINQLEILMKIEQKHKFTAEQLQILKSTLQIRYSTLLEANSSNNVDVICLDSDEEDKLLEKSSTILENLNTTLTLGPHGAFTQKQENFNEDTPELTITPIDPPSSDTSIPNSSENVLSAIQPECTSTESLNTSKISDDSNKQFINIANLSDKSNSGNGLHLNVNTFKRNSEANPATSKKNIVFTVLNTQVVATPIDKTKVPKKLLMVPNQALRKSSSPIERIDLSNFSTSSVSSMLGANLTCKEVRLTKAQLNSLKAISEKSKLTRVFLNKIDCDKEANIIDEPLSLT